MSVSLPNGSTVGIASGYSTATPVSAITNASPGHATAAANGLASGEYIEITSGWSKLNGKVVRATDVTADAFSFEGVDTTDVSKYPMNAGAGTVRGVTGFTQLAQITNSSSDGGEQQFLTYQFLESDSQSRIPTTKTPAGITFTVADDPTLPGYILAKAANDDRIPRAVLLTKSNGEKIVYNAYISLSVIPSLTVNELMSVQVTLSLVGDPVRYPS